MIEEKWGKPHPLHDPYILSHFNARPTDVLITTAPKAGTTWMQQILHQLRTGGDDTFNNIEDVVPWLERSHQGITWQQRLHQLEQLDNPRLFKTHCTYDQTPGFGVAKIIMTSRDPRDCCVSFYHHLMNMTDKALEYVGASRPLSFDHYFDDWMRFGAWYRNVQSWWPYHEHRQVLWLRYEDLVNNFQHQLDQIVSFLGWSITDAQRAKVTEYCSFQWMKTHTERFETRFDSGESMFKPKLFVRKGEVGDHHALLSEKHKALILKRANDELDKDCLEYLNLDQNI